MRVVSYLETLYTYKHTLAKMHMLRSRECIQIVVDFAGILIYIPTTHFLCCSFV